MQYYEVFVSSQRYHGNEALTYTSAEQLAIGAVVVVPMQRQLVLGIVTKEVAKPRFATKLVERIIPSHPVPHQLLTLHNWIHAYYPSPLGLVTQLFVPQALVRQARTKATIPVVSTPEIPINLPALTSEQQTAYNTIKNTTARTTLLHGDTATGKTRLYIELAGQMLQNNKSAIILTPEIGLTPQLVMSIEQAFPGQVVTVHSTLGDAARRSAWLRIANSDSPLIVVGPRSALFSPLQNIGLIVLDEAHDTAYKQEQMPHYQASRVAAKLAELHNAKLVLGTATPLVTDYYALNHKRLPTVRMRERAVQSAQTETNITIVNLKERGQFSRSPWLSDQLLKSINQALRGSQQALVFLNRRGSARLVLCQACGWQADCNRCDIPLTYHGDSHILRCHTCGLQRSTPPACENCGSADILFRSIGTKSLETELQRLFPNSRIARYDSDNLVAERLEHNYQDVRDGKVDIIVGTQLLTKGLDLPLLSVVGVVVADTTLYFPDYTAEERTYQMITQVIGRVGRGHQTSHVIVQTYHPESDTLRAAINRDYQSFYNSQLQEREQFMYPPFCHTLKLVCDRANSRSAQQAAHKLADTLRTHNLALDITGPAPAFIERTHDRYYWQLIIKAKQRSELLKVIALLPKNWNYDIDPTNLL